MDAPNASADTDSLRSAYERFCEIPAAYARLLQETHRNSLNRWNDACNTFIAAIQSVNQDSRKHLEEVQRTYQTSSQETLSKGEDVKQQGQVYRNYLELLSRTYEETQKRQQEAARGYGTALAQLWDEGQAQSLEAYRSYLQSMKEAWASLDVSQVVNSVKLAPK